MICNDTASTEIYTYLHTLSLHDALPIYRENGTADAARAFAGKEFLRQRGHDVPLIGIGVLCLVDQDVIERSDEHTSELQSLMRISYAVFCLIKKSTESNSDLHAAP